MFIVCGHIWTLFLPALYCSVVDPYPHGSVPGSRIRIGSGFNNFLSDHDPVCMVLYRFVSLEPDLQKAGSFSVLKPMRIHNTALLYNMVNIVCPL